MSNLGFHHSLSSLSAVWRAVGGAGLAAQQISPAFEWGKSLEDRQQHLTEEINTLLEHLASRFLLQGAD